jgi:hypothetical protein
MTCRSIGLIVRRPFALLVVPLAAPLPGKAPRVGFLPPFLPLYDAADVFWPALRQARVADERWQQLRRWWAARRRATLAAFDSRWDSQRESLKTSRADAALEMAAARGALSMATMLYGFTR